MRLPPSTGRANARRSVGLAPESASPTRPPGCSRAPAHGSVPAMTCRLDIRPEFLANIAKAAPWYEALSSNGEHEPPQAAAADSGMQTDRIGCLRLAACSLLSTRRPPNEEIISSVTLLLVALECLALCIRFPPKPLSQVLLDAVRPIQLCCRLWAAPSLGERNQPRRLVLRRLLGHIKGLHYQTLNSPDERCDRKDAHTESA